jgi:hypothetical protein
MAERPLDRLLPQALALVLGLGALAAGVAGIAADFIIGRPSSTAGVGIVLMFPLVLFAAVIGFAAGHFIGMALRRRGITPAVPMKPYRLVLAAVLVGVMAVGATLGARPVIRHERLHEPRVIAGAGSLAREEGVPEDCGEPAPAVLACDISSGVSSSVMAWNGREVTLGCTREGRVTVSDASSGLVAAADLSAYEYVRTVYAATSGAEDGRDGLVMLAGLRATGGRHMLVLFDADGRVVYQELLRGRRAPQRAPLGVCAAEDAAGFVVDLGTPVTYRTR